MTQSYPPELQRTHMEWLKALTAIPTAAGRERRVIDWIIAWAGKRPDLVLRADASGNLTIERSGASPASDRRPLYITAHLDHPAFVVESIIGPAALGLSFRGGVRDPYFADAPIRVVTATGEEFEARIIECQDAKPFKHYVAELTDTDADRAGIAVGDIARWAMDGPEITDGILHTHACDDLAAVVAALAALDRLADEPDAAHVRLLFTRAEEVGFVGATAAMKAGVVPREARMVLLENSRSFAESPLGAGPIVRVGDRLSTFSPMLTAGFGRLAEDLVEKRKDTERPFRWQRKLMPGGACEATVYQAYAYEATCLCLPLGNYHNMANLAEVESGDEAAVAGARCDREFISIDDFLNLVDLLVEAGTSLADAPPLIDRLDKLYDERKHVLD